MRLWIIFNDLILPCKWAQDPWSQSSSPLSKYSILMIDNRFHWPTIIAKFSLPITWDGSKMSHLQKARGWGNSSTTLKFRMGRAKVKKSSEKSTDNNFLNINVKAARCKIVNKTLKWINIPLGCNLQTTLLLWAGKLQKVIISRYSTKALKRPW
jgi:hypothetical protein